MNSGTSRPFQRLPRALNIRSTGPRQTGNDRPPYRRRNGLHRLEVAIRRNREPGFNHVHTQPVELTRHAQLLLHIHAATRRLLPIP